MTNYNITNNFVINGSNNTINLQQDMRSGSAETLGMVLKFLALILLSPVLVPVLIGTHGYKMMTEPGGKG